MTNILQPSEQALTLSVVIPAHNEEGCIVDTLSALVEVLAANRVPFELLVVADHCSDQTVPLIEEFGKKHPEVRHVVNPEQGGFGMAVRCGLDNFSGDAVAILMADGSDSPEDLVAYYHCLQRGTECVFGSRFIAGGQVNDYPIHKLLLNRLANHFIRSLFWHGLNDTTNAFKCYRRHVIDGCRPFLSKHFNLTVEIPLKAAIRGYSYEIIPISWRNRAHGVSKLKIKEMGSRYLFIVLHLLLERQLSCGDYHRRQSELPSLKAEGRSTESMTEASELS